MRRLSGTAKAGLIVIAIGLLPILSLAIWRLSLDTVPVEKPISLSVGHIRQTFAVNFTGTYRLEIEAERKLPHATLQCLLGIRDIPEGQCKGIPSALRFDWTLTEDGKTIQSGSSGASVGGSYTDATVANQFAWLDAKRGRHYSLELNILQDGSALAVANPKLRIGVDEAVYEGSIFVEVIALGWAVLACLVGGPMLIVSLVRARKARRLTANSSPSL